jgi:hypothetical protein
MNDQQFADEEINFFLTTRSSVWGASATALLGLAAKLSREADTVDKDLRDMLSSRAKAYSARARQYDMMAAARSGALPYAGGISIADKIAQELNLDRVPPGFAIEMDTNYLPVAPVGNEGTPLATVNDDQSDNV